MRRLKAILSGKPGDGLAIHLYRPHDTIDPAPRLKLYRHGEPLTLSDVLPLLENMGTKVIDERPYEIRPAGADPVWIYDFGLHREALAGLDVAEVRERFAGVRTLTDTYTFQRAAFRDRGHAWNEGLVINTALARVRDKASARLLQNVLCS